MPQQGANNFKAGKKIAESLAKMGYKTVYLIKNVGGRYAYWVQTKGRKKAGRTGKVRRL